jgi:hypothetical protein
MKVFIVIRYDYSQTMVDSVFSDNEKAQLQADKMNEGGHERMYYVEEFEVDKTETES